MSRSAVWALTLAVAGCIAPSAPTAATRAAATPPAPPAVAPVARRCGWPDGARAAVSLTYDDAMPSQLLYAVPVLERYSLKATFFLSGSHMASFARLTASGHELGSHTVTHPCNAELAKLSLSDMGKELDAGISAVHALGASGKLTFAYPCGQTRVAGAQSYVPLVEQRFRAARGVTPAVVEPSRVDLFDVPALFPADGSDGTELLAFVERAVQSGGWAVVGVHGVSEAGEYLQLSQAAHDRLLEHLADNRREIWTAPFGRVADAVAACRALPPAAP